MSATPPVEELTLSSAELPDGGRQVVLSVPSLHCGACVRAVEGALAALPGILHVRANLTRRQVLLQWRGAAVPPVMTTLSSLGYPASLPEEPTPASDRPLQRYILALAVAGFAAGNIMLLSVSVWSGADASTRDSFHWLSALIALPALAWSGQVFFRSALGVLRHGRTNMDVPISLGVLLATGMSLYDTITGGDRVYFEAALMLVFFLLIGRTLDHLMRERARQAVAGLARLAPRGSWILQSDGQREYQPLEAIALDDRLLVPAGEHIPVDGIVDSGTSDIDCSLVSGESTPLPATPGTRLVAGTLNLSGPLTVCATATADTSFVAQTRRLMEAAESGRGQYRRIADRAAALYAPVVHLVAAASFLGWYLASGDMYHSITIAVAVLIITCPCALGLAVPMVHVMAARRLFEQGMLIKDGAALERLANIDTVVFDKTGTLTLNSARLVDSPGFDRHTLMLAAALAMHSSHPRSRSLSAAARHRQLNHLAASQKLQKIQELPGFGIQAYENKDVLRLGRADWALSVSDTHNSSSSTVDGHTKPVVGGNVVSDEGSPARALLLTRNGSQLAQFMFEDTPRPDALGCLLALRQRGLSVELLSGDAPASVAHLASTLSIERYQSSASPADKVQRVETLSKAGRQVLMVGDGINDAPALMSAQASMAPGSAADIGRNAADVVFLRDNLLSVDSVLGIAQRTAALVRQNFIIAVAYNMVALPFAIAGFVTPLVAALAMSSSSILVVLNALRLSRISVSKALPERLHQPSDGRPAPSPLASHPQ